MDGFAVDPVSLVHTCRRLFMPRSGHSVGRWVGPRDPLIQVRTSSMAVLFGKHSRPERLRRVLRSPSWSRVLVAVQSCLMGGGLKSHGEWV